MAHRVHGLVIAGASSLPVAPLAPDLVGPADVTYRVALGEASPFPAAAGHQRADDPDDPWVVERWHGDVLLVEFPGSATFRLRPDEVVLVARSVADDDLVTHLFLDHVLPRVVALRGDLMLHAAGAVGPSGRAHLLLGPTGTGKSTLATALAAAGWPLLDDDGIRVEDGPTGPCAVPGYAGVRLLPDAADAVLSGVAPGPPMARGHPKRRFALEGTTLAMAERPAPVGGIYVLERTEVAQPSVDRLGFGEAVGALTEHGFHLAVEPEAITRQAFERSSALAAAVPIWRLHHPVGLDRLDRTRALLADLDAVGRG